MAEPKRRNDDGPFRASTPRHPDRRPVPVWFGGYPARLAEPGRLGGAPLGAVARRPHLPATEKLHFFAAECETPAGANALEFEEQLRRGFCGGRSGECGYFGENFRNIDDSLLVSQQRVLLN